MYLKAVWYHAHNSYVLFSALSQLHSFLKEYPFLKSIFIPINKIAIPISIKLTRNSFSIKKDNYIQLLNNYFVRFINIFIEQMNEI